MRPCLTALALLLASAGAPAGADDLSAVLHPGAAQEWVATGLQFAEGPVWDGRRLLVSDVQGDTLYELADDGELRPVRTPTRWASGHSWDPSGALLAAEHASGEVTRRSADGTIETLASHYDGHRLNSPNGVVARSDGMVYFTDPPFGLQPPYGPVERTAELDFAGVYRVDPATGAVTLLTDDLRYPNGIAFSPDESRLYITDTGD
jgi:gluconolactonase